MFTYPAVLEIPLAHPALPSGTLGTLPALLRTLFVIPNSPGTKARSLFLGGGEFPVWIYDMVHTSPGYSYINVVSKAGTIQKRLLQA